MNEQLDRIELKMTELESRLDKIFASSEKTRRTIFWTAIITLAFIVLPLIAIPFVIPAFLQSVQLPAGF